MKELNEYKNHPKWIDTMTKERQYEWYLYAKKEALPRYKRMGSDTNELENAIKDYETKHGISS